VKTTAEFIFGGFTTAEWESVQYGNCPIDKQSPASFLFSVNEGSKYPLTDKDDFAIGFYRYSVKFGKKGLDLVISEINNVNNCLANQTTYMLPPA
jgi:hypothetical protein